MKRIIALFLVLFTFAPSTASASMFKAWIAGRGDYLDVSGDLFNNRENDFSFGADIGIELLGITAFGEILWLEDEQMLFTLNIGMDFSFGETVRLHLGGYTGPMFFLFPNADPPAGTDLSGLSSTEQSALLSAGGFASLDEAEAAIDIFGEEEEELGRLAFGWNLIRARVGADVGLFGPLYLGIAGQVGYHLIISGEEVAAGAKNEALDTFMAENDIPTDLAQPLREAVGAQAVDQENLSGINYDVNLYLRVEF